jgi:exosortase
MSSETKIVRDARNARLLQRLAAHRSLLPYVAVCGLIVVSFYAPFVWMLNQWFVVEEYSPGPAVPILASIALWHVLKGHKALPTLPRRRGRQLLLGAAVLALLVYVGKEYPRTFPGLRFLSALSFTILFASMTLLLISIGFLLAPKNPSAGARRLVWMGMALLLFSLLVHFFALRGDLARASIVAYISLLFGIAWYLHGWSIAKTLLFPFGMLLFMVPVEFIDETLGVPLRLMATSVSVYLMRMVGLDVLQTGNWFAIGSMEFSVDAPCSGLKSLIALTALGATYAYVTQPTFFKKLLLACCAIPIALVTNIVRLACVGIFAQLINKDFAVTVFHDQAAVFLYVLAILIFMSLDKKVFQAEWFRVKNF